jgi:SAM-dependent methyltransferase
MNKTPASPITGSFRTELHSRIPVDRIINGYAAKFNIDISRFFGARDEIDVFRCLDTGLRFYFPRDIDGDGKFYAELQNNAWYYPPWKWEFSICENQIPPKARVLEIGCGNGAFLKHLQNKSIAATGLELNAKAIAEGRAQGLDVRAIPIQEFSRDNVGAYDFVCSFQVMEHVSDLKPILDASINVLKPGGTLFISVPNNESIIKHDREGWLNMPPHHMNLWEFNSLKSLTKIYPLAFLNAYFEPIQDGHVEWCRGLLHGRAAARNKFYQFVNRKLSNLQIRFFRSTLKCHTITMSFQKLEG